jgi:GPH family glycoside/pentoside/hexuronide:cation symporter
MTYFLGFDEDRSSVAFLFLFICTVVWIPLISITTKKVGKRLSWIIYVGLWGLVMSVGMIFVTPERILLFYGLLFLASGGVGGVYLIGWSMMADIVEVDEFKTGQRREGTYMGIIDLIQKGGCALSLWIVGLILSLVGYVPEVKQTDQALLAIRLLFSEGTALLIFSSVLFCYLDPMTKAKHDSLRKAIADKKEGQQYDTSDFEDILI